MTEKRLNEWQLECAFKAAVAAAERAASTGCPIKDAEAVANAALAAQKILNPSAQQKFQDHIDQEHQARMCAINSVGEKMAAAVVLALGGSAKILAQDRPSSLSSADSKSSSV